MSPILAAVIALLLWITTVWRAVRVWRKGVDRTLWWTFFGLAVMMTLRLPAGRVLDQWTGITDLSYLLKHLFGGVLSSATLLAFLRGVSGQSPKGRQARTLRIVIPLVTAVIMTALFLAELQPYETNKIFRDPTARWALVAYTVVFLGYLSSSLVGGIRVCWRWSGGSDSHSLGWGLRIIGGGLAAGVAYCITRIAAIVTRVTGDGVFRGDVDDYVSTYLLMAALLMIVTGSSLPAAVKLRAWHAERTTLLRLRPLWRELTDATPSVRLNPMASCAAERLDPRHVHSRLYRRTIEIRDAALSLSDYAPLYLREEAMHHVQSHGLFGTQAATAAEACWLAVARHSKLAGVSPAEHLEHQPAGGGTDLTTEITALTQLSDAYHSELVREFADEFTHDDQMEPQA
ncbi:MAB_1171c family putative transporter [Streptomyces sp. NPDC058991]|uniref:MAB_1171c family putative transporter n=1 Tax=unclassified Streptomyces TaxID=2593676 RepID=UPI003691D6D8